MEPAALRAGGDDCPRVFGAGIDGVELTFVTPEARPLEAVRAGARPRCSPSCSPRRASSSSVDIRRVGHAARARAAIGGSTSAARSRCRCPPDRRSPGFPPTPGGFIPVDEHGARHGIDDVYAAGDATTFPIKQGGLAAQQAVAAAEAIAARHGADLDPQPFRPVLRGMLLTGGQERWMRAPAGDTPGEARRRCARCGGPPPRSPAATSPRTSWGGRRPIFWQPLWRADFPSRATSGRSVASDERRQREPNRDRLRRLATTRAPRSSRPGRCCGSDGRS